MSYFLRENGRAASGLEWRNGSRGGIRTPDRVVNSHLLCRLSYPGTLFQERTDKTDNQFLYQKSPGFVNRSAPVFGRK